MVTRKVKNCTTIFLIDIIRVIFKVFEVEIRINTPVNFFLRPSFRIKVKKKNV